MASFGCAPPSPQQQLGGDRRLRRGDPVAQQVRPGDGGRERGDAQRRRHVDEAGEAERQQLAALGGDERMQLVEHDAAQRAEGALGVGVAEQQRQLLGRRHQDIGRGVTLALAAVRRGVAGARLDLDGCAHIGNGDGQIARHVDGQRLERGDVERVEAGRRVRQQIVEAGEKTGERLAGAGRGDQQRRGVAPPGGQHVELVPARRPAPCPRTSLRSGDGGPAAPRMIRFCSGAMWRRQPGSARPGAPDGGYAP